AHADEESWGAIAVSLDMSLGAQRTGASKNMSNQGVANLAAIFECQAPRCEAMISFKYPECGAVVRSGDNYYKGLGASQREAEQDAINQSLTITTTKVLRSQCNDAPSGR